MYTLLLFIFLFSFLFVSSHQVYIPKPMFRNHLSVLRPGTIKTSQTCDISSNIFQGCSNDCSSLKMCIANHIYLVNCKTQSNGRNPFCNQTSNVCQAEPVSCKRKGFICPTKDGFYPDPLDCRKYYQCSDGRAFEGSCNWYFDPRTPGCSTGRWDNCYNFSFRKDGLCRNKLYKTVRHPLDYNVFVFCDEQPLVLRCPNDQIFDLNLNRCRFNCKERGTYPDKDDINSYYECTKNLNYYHKECPDGMYYNVKFKGCTLY